MKAVSLWSEDENINRVLCVSKPTPRKGWVEWLWRTGCDSCCNTSHPTERGRRTGNESSCWSSIIADEALGDQVYDNETPDPLNISTTQPPPLEDMNQATSTVLSQMLGEVKFLTHVLFVVQCMPWILHSCFLTQILHWNFLTQETQESLLSQPQGPLPDSSFILNN